MKKNLVFSILIFILLSRINIVYGFKDDGDNEEVFKEFIQEAYDIKCRGFMLGDFKKLKSYYDVSKKYGQWSYEYEAKRTKYLWDWSNDRGIEFTAIKPEISIKRIRKKDNMYLLSIDEICEYKYRYKDDKDKSINTFEISLEHSLGLVEKDGEWLISRDWYADCFEDAVKLYSGIYVGDYYNPSHEKTVFTIPQDDLIQETSFFNTGLVAAYNRKKAVEYADKYYRKYNPKYRDYNGIGGDCTNYVSQCLSDKDEGGALKYDGAWFCSYPKYGKPEGSKAFVNADAFKSYIVYSKRGWVLMRGDFSEVSKPRENKALGVLEDLRLGDLICYEKKGQIDHFSIITAKDSKGFPMINSHTVDRFHVPFDLGWGTKTVRFHLIKL